MLDFSVFLIYFRNKAVIPLNTHKENYRAGIPDFADEIKDPAIAFEDLGDNNFFLELKRDFAKEMVTGFISLDGMTVGCVANRTAVYGEDGSEQESFEARLTSDGCDKAASFIKTCDAFNIPILTLTNVEGFATTVEEEKTIESDEDLRSLRQTDVLFEK